ncbi:MAG: SseB family protein [Legionellales bacterium]|nr:SseB family protein [Legionellales bacterium]
MNALEQAVNIAIHKNGDSISANKAYLEFIKANFIIPIEKQNQADSEPQVLYLDTGTQTFLPVFSNMPYFDAWAEPIKNDIQILKLSGVDLLKGLGENTYVSFNIGSPIYKEFNPGELARMRSMILKLFGNK